MKLSRIAVTTAPAARKVMYVKTFSTWNVGISGSNR